jgi:hypothetical protein
MAEIEIELPDLAPFQREWIEDKHRFIAIEGATGTGKTHVHEPFLFKQAHSPKARGDEYWWIAPTVEQARAVYENIKRLLEDSGAIGLYKCTDTLREIETPTGGILCFKTGEKPNHLFGIRNVRGIIVDEFTRCRLTLWPALLSVANKTGCWVRFIGNYQGEDSAWHLWILSMEGDKEFVYYRTTALAAVEAGIMPQERMDTARRTLPDVIFKALYLCEGSVDESLLVTYKAVADLWTNDHVPEGTRCITADIALHGSDRFVMGVWSGMRLKEITVLEKKTAQEIEAILKGKATEHGVSRSNIVFDADGLGAYLKSYLQGGASYQGGTISIPQAAQKMSYARLRDQCHFLTADKINAGGMYIETEMYREEIGQELIATLRKLGQNAAGQWQIVPKDHSDPNRPGAKQRLGRSPDLADMIVMRQFLELTPSPKFAEGLERGRAKRTVSFKPKTEGNTPWLLKGR